MISHQYKCIFIHIPKTGGTSIENVLRQDKSKGSDHRLLHEYSNYSGFNSYFKFAIVRNTYDRIWSIYNYYSSGGNQQKNQTLTDYYYHYKNRIFNFPFYTDLEIREKMPRTFQEFCERYLKHAKPFFRKHVIQSQLDYISINGNVKVDFAGKFDCLENDFSKVAKQLGVQENLPHLRKSLSKGHYSEFYNEETRQIVENYYQDEINYFRFKFED